MSTDRASDLLIWINDEGDSLTVREFAERVRKHRSDGSLDPAWLTRDVRVHTTDPWRMRVCEETITVSKVIESIERAGLL